MSDTTKRIWKQCPECEGSGFEPDADDAVDETAPCAECGGSGEVDDLEDPEEEENS